MNKNMLIPLPTSQLVLKNKRMYFKELGGLSGTLYFLEIVIIQSQTCPMAPFPFSSRPSFIILTGFTKEKH